MIKRECNLLKFIGKTRGVILLGPRGTGKSNLCQESLKELISDKARYQIIQIDLLKNDLYRKYLLHPELIRTEIEGVLKLVPNKLVIVFIDEVQKIPSILNEVHLLMETYPQQLFFLLTGSSARKLKKENANMLAGRAIQTYLFPLTTYEIGSKENLLSTLKFGTLPLVYTQTDESIKKDILNTYVDTYLKEEIKEEAIVRNLEAFLRFLEISGQMNGEPINFSKISRECSVTDNTIKEYYQILLDTLMGFQISGWNRSVRKQIQKSPRFYYFDNGVLNAINRELGLELSPSSNKSGKLFEFQIIQEFYRNNIYLRKNFKFYYWRTVNGAVVDLILQKNSTQAPIAIEIKLSNLVFEDDLKNLKIFKSEEPSAALYLICNCENSYTLGDVTILPWRSGILEILNLG